MFRGKTMYKRLLSIAVALFGSNAKYKVIDNTFIGGTIVRPRYIDYSHKTVNRLIVWDGIPNHAMEPLNLRAHVIYSLFLKISGHETIFPYKDIRLSTQHSRAQFFQHDPNWHPRLYTKKVV